MRCVANIRNVFLNMAHSLLIGKLRQKRLLAREATSICCRELSYSLSVVVVTFAAEATVSL